MYLTDVEEYREELILSLSSARELAATNVQAVQQRYKQQYHKTACRADYRVGDWVLVLFPAEETGKKRKLSRPWHGPYRIIARSDPDVTVAKVHFPEDGTIRVHQLRVCPCPPLLPAGFYWYGGNRKSPGRVPQWLQQLLSRPRDVHGQERGQPGPDLEEGSPGEQSTPDLSLNHQGDICTSAEPLDEPLEEHSSHLRTTLDVDGDTEPEEPCKAGPPCVKSGMSGPADVSELASETVCALPHGRYQLWNSSSVQPPPRLMKVEFRANSQEGRE